MAERADARPQTGAGPGPSGRLRLCIIFGGQSGEHQVSVVSAQHVIAAADRFDVVPIGLSKKGAWLTPEETARERVRERFGIELELEIALIGEGFDG